MPANLPPQYIKLEAECRGEKDPQRKLELLQQMLRDIPKHKGTSHLQGEIKAKISKTKLRLSSAKKSGGVKHATLDHIPREGAGQFVLFGPPNGGKSSVLAALTHAHVAVTEWPFGTRKPQPGMARWENVPLQLVDTPSISDEFCEKYVFNLIRTADVAVLVLSLGDDDLLDEYEFVINRVFQGKVRLEGLVAPDPTQPTMLSKETMILATGTDLPDAETRLDLLTEAVGGGADIVTGSTLDPVSLKSFLSAGFSKLQLLRVYSRAPGQEPDRDDPILLPHGGSVADAAREIHKDFAEGLHHARLWSATNPAFQGQRVPADHIVEEGDVLEFHI